MSGIEFSEGRKEKPVHACTSCMNKVIQTFGHLQEQIKILKKEKTKLQMAVKKLSKENEGKTRVMKNKIKALEKELAKLEKKS